MTTPSTLTLMLPSGRVADVRVRQESFSPWPSDPPPRTFGTKAVVEFEGQGMFPEIAAVQMLRSEGWEAVWASTYGGLRFFNSQPQCQRRNTANLPHLIQSRLGELATANGGWAGIFDVVAWRDEALFFTELKRRGHDSIRKTQLQWVDTAMMHGYDLAAFQILEWDFR